MPFDLSINNEKERTERLLRTPWFKELEQKLRNKVKADIVTLQLYSTAACFYEITPLAVVMPQNVEDIINTIQICSKNGIPVLPRGAGSSLCGNSVGEAVILDLTHEFKNVEFMDDNRVKTGIGVVLNNLQEELKSRDKKFAPDPSSGNVCVIGGMLGNNSGGPHTLKHGGMHKHVEQINVILSNGKIFNARNILVKDIPKLDEFHRWYYQNVKFMLEKYSNKISSSRLNTTKNSSGYLVWDVLTDSHLNMASLMIGSEGTLGVFTDAVLKILPIVPYRGLISFYFTDIEKMGISVKHLRSLGASAIEFVDHSFIQLALKLKPELKKFLPEHIKYLLYVEFESDGRDGIENLFAESEKIICEKERLAEVGAYSTNETEIEKIVTVRKAATAILNKIHGNEKPVPFIEDAAVHPDVFSYFLADLNILFSKHSIKYVAYGHAGDGHLHIRPLLNFKEKKTFSQADSLMREFTDLVLKYRGTLSGEHGDGRLRTPYLSNCYPDLIPLFEELKNLFDPQGIMNPGIIVSSHKNNWNDNLRYTPAYLYNQTFSKLDMGKWRTEVEKCHGCGTCREYCPVFIATGEEESTARAKANILRGIISGKLSSDNINTASFYKTMDYCFNCGQCLTDCPTEVNIPGMAVLAKEKLHENLPYKINEYILQRGKTVSRLASTIPLLSNWSLNISSFRYLMHLFTGIHKQRKFPKFLPILKFEKPYQSNGNKKVVLWSGCSAQYNDPKGELINSVQLLGKLGYDAIIPNWKCCNIAKLTYGNIVGSLDDIKYNLNVLAPFADDNIPILFSSASCGYAFMHEYPMLFPDNEVVVRVSESCYDIHDFLGKIFIEKEIANLLSPINKKIVYHAPCHLKIQKNKYGPFDLLQKIPELKIENIRDSCCGIAGTFGMKKENFDLSMIIGSKLFQEIKKAQPDYVISGCGTCQIQIKQGTDIDVIHPITLLNQSYCIK